jgi:hypothetical protein
VATAVLFGRANAPAVAAMRCHVGLLVWCDVDNNLGAWRGKGRLVEVEVEVAKETGAGRQLGLAPRQAKEVERDVGLGHEQIPFG